MKLVLGTRGSMLARAQSGHVAGWLRDAGHEVELRIIVTRGDRELDRTVPELGGKGLFTAELEEALREGSIHLAVHSLKDLPTDADVAAIPKREDWRDAVVGRSLAAGGRIGTASLRRQSQIRARFPQCEVVPVRGNVDTRIGKVRGGDLDAVVLAAAGVHRLDRADEIGEYLDFVPAPAQGALAIQAVREDVRSAVAVLHDPATALSVAAERAFLRELEGGCSVPVGAIAVQGEGGALTLRGFVGSVDGSRVLHDELRSGDSAGELGVALAQRMLRAGAKELLT